MADLLRPRFAATHDIEEIWTCPRTPDDLPKKLWPATLFFSRERLLELGTEHRDGPMRWLAADAKVHLVVPFAKVTLHRRCIYPVVGGVPSPRSKYHGG